ncbi:hypothetical protein ZWY2020_015390 [Hordeum vulgare]|nr:hypothetical protein ZWY2020_015390 [Hordeum vulgare]
MGLLSAVDWWEEWQMRILVLGSLFVQFLLLCSAPFRKYAIPSWYRSIVWLAYLGGDAIAIYGLATLFNRQRRQDSGSANSSTSILEVVWAPVLLMHLGGQDHITAYNIEDNELWTRHLLTAVSQITVAVYVFSKSWKGGDKRLLQAAIVLFVPGILKCIEKPWTLKNASINSLVSSSDPQLMTAAGKSISLEEYVEGAIAFAQDDHVPQAQGEAPADDLEANQHLQAHAEDHSDDPKPNHAPKIEHKCKDFLDQRWCMKPCKSSIALTELVLEYVKKGWKDQITDVESYWKFIDHRGEWTLQNKCEQDLIWSLRRPFDESVILWHIATDFCFFRCKAYPHERAREMSNYLTYLLFVKPEMLLPGTRCNLFKTANDELEAIVKQVKGDKLSLKAILKGDKPSQDILKGSKSFIQFLTGEKASQDEVEKGLMEIIFAKMKEREEVASCTELPLDADKNPAAEGLINNAWKISEALLAIDDESKMWNVIEGVWVEMLCFSASRCRGYLHAKSLGSGGELLTYIWLLLSHMGMETLPERLQRTELSTEEGNASIPPSTSQIPGSKMHHPSDAQGFMTLVQEIQPAE